MTRTAGSSPPRPVRRARRLVPLAAGAACLLLLLGLSRSGRAADTSDPFVSFDRVRALLENPDGSAGDLPVECTVRLQPPRAGRNSGRMELPIEVLVDLRGLDAPPESLRVTLAAATIEGELATFQETASPIASAPSAATSGDSGSEQAPEMWLYRGHLQVADEVNGAAAVVEAVDQGRWGGCFAELADMPLAPPAGLRVAIYDPTAPAGQAAASVAGTGSPPPAAAPTASPTEESGPTVTSTAAPAEPAAAPAPRSPFGTDRATAQPAAGGSEQIIVLLPPKHRPAQGRTDFDTMVTSGLVRSAVFYLDGKEVATDGRAPFSATIDLGGAVAPHTVRVVGRDRSGVPMGEHEIKINRRSAPFDVAITGVHPVLSHRPAALPGNGSFIHVEARIDVPPGKSLDRVEFYENQDLVATLRQPPWNARLPAGTGDPDPSAYARVVAVLTDGSSLEDVRLLSAGTPSERVEVNLVQLFAVVTNPDGAPVEGLGPDDFRVTFGGERRPVERFQVADDVPLTLGLLVDTSGSMDTLMIDAKQAAGRFLLQTLIPGDEAFLVDFADRPRLLQPATGDTTALLRSFTQLNPGGFTALYDAIVFSLAQLQETSGRRALVLVTDGYDEGSRFTTRRAIHDARRLAVPVYVISLAGLYNERGNVRRSDLEAVTEHTGGRVYYIGDKADLTAAYDEINRELRSQYVLAFGTERFLTEDELDDVKLEVLRDGLEVRWTAGSAQ